MSFENTVVKSAGVRNNFTLVEILAVMGLMIILLFIALPAFEKIAKGGGVEIAARNIAGRLGLARGYAINNRQYVALLMPDANLPNDYLCRSYKLCVVNTTPTNNVFNFSKWLPSENWGFLPAGTAIHHINSTQHNGSADGTGTFSPTAFACEQVDRVKLSEIHPTAYANVDNVRAIVFKPNGMLAGSGNSRYVAVSESTHNGTELIPTNKKNWIDITVDQFTGRVTYGAD